MTVRCLFSLAILLILAAAGAGRPIQPVEVRLIRVVEVDAEDRGLIPPGSPVERKVHLVNQSKSVLQVRLIQKTCGCVSFSLEHDRIGVGEFTEVKVGTTAVQDIGPQRHGAELEVSRLAADGTTSDPERITVFYQYTPDLAYTVVPDRILIDVVQGTEFRSTAFVHRFAADHLKVLAATCSIGGVHLGKAQASDNHPDVLKVPISGSTPALGLRVGRVDITLDDKQNPKVIIPIAIRTVAAISVEPAAIVCNRSELREVYAFTIRPRPGHEAAIQGISASASGTDCGVEIDPVAKDGSRVLRVRLDRAEVQATGSLKLELRSAASVEISVPIRVVWFNDN